VARKPRGSFLVPQSQFCLGDRVGEATIDEIRDIVLPPMRKVASMNLDFLIWLEGFEHKKVVRALARSYAMGMLS
jgi:hypothetical protein